MNKPCEFTNYEPSFVDGCGGKSVLSEMWPLANRVIDGGCSVQLKVSYISCSNILIEIFQFKRQYPKAGSQNVKISLNI